MTIFTGPVFNWRTSGLNWDAPPYESSSPNLVALAQYMRETFGGGSMGIHYDKKTSDGVDSEHSWGAADDWGSGQAQVDWLRSVGRPVGKALTRSEHFGVIDWVVAHSAELHVQSIVDIGRSWRADRTDNGANGWKPYNSGYTGHAHIVTTFDGWSDSTPIADRLAPPAPTHRVDLLDISEYQTITKYADVGDVPIVHRVITKEGNLDTRFASRAPHLFAPERSELCGGYVVLSGGIVGRQMDAYVAAMRPHWRDGAFTQLDVEPWHGVPTITIDALAEAIAAHSKAFGPGRLCVYMNPLVLPDLWGQFVARFPDIPRWVPGYRTDDEAKAIKYDAAIWQWTDKHTPPGFTGNTVDANEIRNLAAVRRIAGLDKPAPIPTPTPEPTPTPAPIPEPEPEEAMPVILIEPANRKGLFDLSGAPVSIEVYKVLVAVHGQPVRVTSVDKIPAGIGTAKLIVVSQNHPYWDAYVDEQLGTQGRAMYDALGPRT